MPADCVTSESFGQKAVKIPLYYQAADTLAGINPDVALEAFHMNVTTLKGFDAFKASLTDDQGSSRVDLVLSCVDNYEARMTINQVLPSLLQGLFPTQHHIPQPTRTSSKGIHAPLPCILYCRAVPSEGKFKLGCW